MSTTKASVKKMPDWSHAERRYLVENYGKTSMNKIRARLGRTESAIHTKASSMGIARVRWGLDRRHNNLVTKPKAMGRKAGTRSTQEHRNTRKYKTIPFTAKGKRVIKIDSKTHMYVADTTTKQELEEILRMYRNRITYHKNPF